MMNSPPILADPPGTFPPKRRGRPPRAATAVKHRAALDEFDAARLRPSNACPGCGKDTLPLSLEFVRELIIGSRERVVAAGEHKALIAEVDLMHLAARLENFCGLSCWQNWTSRETAP